MAARPLVASVVAVRPLQATSCTAAVQDAGRGRREV